MKRVSIILPTLLLVAIAAGGAAAQPLKPQLFSATLPSPVVVAASPTTVIEATYPLDVSPTGVLTVRFDLAATVNAVTTCDLALYIDGSCRRTAEVAAGGGAQQITFTYETRHSASTVSNLTVRIVAQAARAGGCTVQASTTFFGGGATRLDITAVPKCSREEAETAKSSRTPRVRPQHRCRGGARELNVR